MAIHTPHRLRTILLASIALFLPPLAQAAKPPVADALKLQPVQKGIEYDIPAEDEISQCSLKPYQAGKLSGWEVTGANGNVLRRFLDTNADNKVDQWCYFKDGIEVYRDIDSNYNRQADQYRWLGTAGIRWAVDTNEDGRVDRWKMISPEEVTEEAVLALRAKDAKRFKLLLLTDQELRDLGLGEEKAKELAAKLTETASSYEKAVASQQLVPQDSRWVNFGGTRPGIVPAGTDGAKEDVRVYENVAAVIENDGAHNQLVIGTLIKVGDVWRMVDLPKKVAGEGLFFASPDAIRAQASLPETGGLSKEIQELISQMEQIDRDLANTTSLEKLAQLNAQRADVLEKLAENATDDGEKASWIRQLVDTISAAAQSGQYPQGIERLAQLGEKLEQQKTTDELLAYIEYREMFADYVLSMQRDGEKDFAKIQEKWLADLDQFVKDFPTSPDAADAMLHLALAEEFAGNDDAALKWYGRVTKEFASTDRAEKATGAIRRIESVGKPLTLAGKDLNGRTVDVRTFRGKVVLVHYWATNYSNCLPGLSVLKDMQTKYGPDKLILIGVNLDNEVGSVKEYLKENPLPWPQLHAPGGFDSPLANYYGIQELPMLMLADQDGNVVSRRLSVSEIDTELRRLLR
jgi:thiol-disulfide isomerase/thioredoxin